MYRKNKRSAGRIHEGPTSRAEQKSGNPHHPFRNSTLRTVMTRGSPTSRGSWKRDFSMMRARSHASSLEYASITWGTTWIRRLWTSKSSSTSTSTLYTTLFIRRLVNALSIDSSFHLASKDAILILLLVTHWSIYEKGVIEK